MQKVWNLVDIDEEKVKREKPVFSDGNDKTSDSTATDNSKTENKSNNSNIDSKLLYVAITRAMHELYINYSGELPISLRTLTKDNKVLKRKK